MRILQISSRFHPFVGGVEDVVANLAKYLQKDKHNVLVVSSRMGEATSVVECVEGVDVKRAWLNLPRSMLGFLVFPLRFFAGLGQLIRAIREFNADIVHYHFPDDSSIYVWLAILATKRPLVLSIHGNDLQIFGEKTWYKFFLQKLIKLSCGIVVHSNYMRTELLKKFPSVEEKITLIPNGVKEMFFGKVYNEVAFSNYMLCYGRLAPKKGFDVAIRAFAKIKDQTTKDLVIAGPGGELKNLESLANELGVASRIHFPGNMEGQNTLDIIKNAEFVILPSRREPFGIIALEFLACGKAIIASKTGGLAEILQEEETALFFENENVDQLAEKILLLNSDTSLVEKLEATAVEEAKRYRWDSIVEDYVLLYQRLTII